MERERFGLRSIQGPRTDSNLPIPVFSDTGYTDLDPAAHFLGGVVPGAPWLWHTYFNDFDSMAEIVAAGTDSDSWDVHLTEGGAGEAAIALADGDGGLLLLTNDDADNDAIFLQKKGESFLYVAGAPMIFSMRLKVSDATQSDFVAGLMITDTTPLDITDGIFFRKDDGDALLDFAVEKNNTATTATGIHTVVADTFLSIAFFYDGRSKVRYGVNGVELGSLALTNAPDDEELAISFGIQNGEAVAKTMTVDYIYAAKYMGSRK